MNKPVIIEEETLVAPVVVTDVAPAATARASTGPVYAVLGGISLSHFLNDTMQSLIPSVYPILKDNYALDYAQIGLITLAFQFTASILQPVVGHFADKKARPFSLATGMGFTFVGLLLLSAAHQYALLLIAACLVGLGSAIFHPEATRIARLSSGGRFGFAQSVFQVGGSFGTAMGPLLAALIVVPFGQPSIAWFSSIAFVAILVLWRIGLWYRPQIAAAKKAAPAKAHPDAPSSRRVKVALVILVVLMFSKQLYTSSLSSYYTFYLIDKFGVSTQAAQLYLFLFLAATAIGTFFGGPLGDRYGRKPVLWFSILGALPFTLALPFVGLLGSAILSVLIGFIISSATPTIIVFAQELIPHRFGMISGVFYGLAFGFGGLGAAVLGEVADRSGIDFVYQLCAVLPALGLLAVFLPRMPRGHT